jgi:hypothetical protein
MMETAQTIDEVIEQLTEIVTWAKHNNSRLGYFAALYLKVTKAVKNGIEAGDFDDGPRMERLDVIFANRYIAAAHQYRNSEATTASWGCAFTASRQWWPIVLQHLLLGMNAHINLDLGIAAAQTSPGDQLPELKNDFDRINGVLASLVGGVQEELAEIWPLLRIFNRYLDTTQTTIINFSMERARNAAWQFAEDLAPLDTHEQGACIAQKDKQIAAFASVIRQPGILASILIKLIRLGERGSTVDKIAILE